jgi:putative transposase
MEASDVKRLKDLEEENSRLKKMFADLSLDNQILKELFAKKGINGRDCQGVQYRCEQSL